MVLLCPIDSDKIDKFLVLAFQRCTIYDSSLDLGNDMIDLLFSLWL